MKDNDTLVILGQAFACNVLLNGLIGALTAKGVFTREEQLAIMEISLSQLEQTSIQSPDGPRILEIGREYLAARMQVT